MSFQEINKIERAQVYLDMAFSKASKISPSREKGASELEKTKHKELAKLDAMNDVLQARLTRIIKEFPAVDNLNEFYSELLKVTLDYDRLKKALGSMNWALKKVRELHRDHRRRLRAMRSIDQAVAVKKAFMGRVSSLFSQIDSNLKYLDDSRLAFREFPVIKEMPTVCICGFPNVGKSTLLGKLTTSKPEIKDYAFTTKRLNLGYMKDESSQIQLIDTPGTLARPEKMNNIEKQAYLAIKYQADLIVFIFDLTHTYPLEDQLTLYDIINKIRKPMIAFLSKTDLMDLKEYSVFADKHDAVTEIVELKKQIKKVLA